MSKKRGMNSGVSAKNQRRAVRSKKSRKNRKKLPNNTFDIQKSPIEQDKKKNHNDLDLRAKDIRDRGAKYTGQELSDLQSLMLTPEQSEEKKSAQKLSSNNTKQLDQKQLDQKQLDQKQLDQKQSNGGHAAKPEVVIPVKAADAPRRRHCFSWLRVAVVALVFSVALAVGFGIGDIAGNVVGGFLKKSENQTVTNEINQDSQQSDQDENENTSGSDAVMLAGRDARAEKIALKQAEAKTAEEARLKAEEEARRKAEQRAQQAVNTGRKLVALTFDDGPSYATTPRLLDVLREKGVKVTFFVVGNMANGAPDLLRREEAEGHEVGSHTTAHVNFSYLNAEQTQAEFAAMNQIFNNILGHPSRIARPPYGNYTEITQVYAGQPMIYWTVDTLDWKYRDAGWVRQQAVGGAFDGAIILMHDIHPTTVDAVAGIIDDLKAQGYELLTVSELAQARGVNMANGGVYGSFR